MARFANGLAVDADVVVAARRAAGAALARLDGRRPDVTLVFVAGDEPVGAGAALEAAAEASGAGAVVGCTAPGVLGDGKAVVGQSAVAVWSAVLPEVRVRTFHLEVMPADAGMAVVGLPEPALDDALALVLADPWSFPVDGFVEGSTRALAGLPLAGVVAGGVRGRGTTRLLVGDRTPDRGAVGVLLGGPVGARTVVSQGCRPAGPPMTVTASEGNVLLALAGVPAADKVAEVVSSMSSSDQALASAGLQIGLPRDEYGDDHAQGDYVVRGIAGIDESSRGLVVGDIVAPGRTIRLQVRDPAAAAAELTRTLASVTGRGGLDTVESVLLFAGMDRASMFSRCDHDLVTTSEVTGTRVVAGCFGAGEIAPVDGRNFVHASSAAAVVFGSGAAAARGTDAQAWRWDASP